MAPERQTAFFRQLFDFRDSTGTLAKTRTSLWAHKADPTVFWRMAGAFAPDLARLAERLAETPATSAASERAFSSMNYIQSPNRNRLRSDRANQLLYIFLNKRTLRRCPIHQAQKARRREAHRSTRSAQAADLITRREFEKALAVEYGKELAEHDVATASWQLDEVAATPLEALTIDSLLEDDRLDALIEEFHRESIGTLFVQDDEEVLDGGSQETRYTASQSQSQIAGPSYSNTPPTPYSQYSQSQSLPDSQT